MQSSGCTVFTQFMNKPYSIRTIQNKTAFKNGFKDGIPIGLGYFAVAFSLGIAAKNAGLSPFQGFLASFLCNASAGEYVGFTLIGAAATYMETALATFVANARYMLMSCSMSQRLDPKMPFIHRILMGFYITDEFFGIAIANRGYLNPYYTYGAVVFAAPCWALGTALGVIAGNLLPMRLVSAFSVALFGMFLAIIVPPARKSKVVCGLILLSFLCSFAGGYIPYFCTLAEGTRTIILTVVLSAAAALLFPCKEEDEQENGTKEDDTDG